MFTLLQIEWLKVKKYKPVWILLIFLIILFPLATMTTAGIFQDIFKTKLGMPDMVTARIFSPFDFNYVFYTSAYINNGLNIAWGMLLILMIGNEFQNKTMRQNVIDGQKRSDIVTSKLLLVLLFSMVSAILVIFSGIVTGLIYSSTKFQFDMIMLKVLGISFIAAIMQMLFALVFAFTIKRPAFSVILYLAYTVLIENAIVHLLFRAALKLEHGRLFLTQAVDELTVSPLDLLSGEKDAVTPATFWITCGVYATAILVFLYKYINRTQLK